MTTYFVGTQVETGLCRRGVLPMLPTIHPEHRRARYSMERGTVIAHTLHDPPIYFVQHANAELESVGVYLEDELRPVPLTTIVLAELQERRTLHKDHAATVCGCQQEIALLERLLRMAGIDPTEGT